MLSFLKKYWFLVLLAFIATSLFVIKVFPVNKTPTPTPVPQSNVEIYKGVIPGKTTTEDLQRTFGSPDPKLSDFSNNTLAYPRQDGGPPDKAIMENDTVGLFRELALSGNLAGFKNKYGEPEAAFFGDHQQSGYKTYVWATKGIAVVAHAEQGLVYEVWHFKSMSIQGFLQQSWAKKLSAAPKKIEGY